MGPVYLYAPAHFWALPKHERSKFGCGPGGIGDLLVPDAIEGVNVKPACEIHDYMYMVGETLEDKKAADRVFLNNMVRLILAAEDYDARDPESKERLEKRLNMAEFYYSAVKTFGGPAFWDRKNKPSEMKEVTT